MNELKLYVWYSPEYNDIRIATKERGYVFKDEYGKFHSYFYSFEDRMIKTINFYLIGEL